MDTPQNQAVESLLTAIDRKKRELDSKRPLIEGESKRLMEEFVVLFAEYVDKKLDNYLAILEI